MKIKHGQQKLDPGTTLAREEINFDELNYESHTCWVQYP